MSLDHLATCLRDVSREEEALEAVEEVARIRRRLALANPLRYEPDLALSLNNLSVSQAAGGLRDAALETIKEAVEIRRRLVSRNRARYEPELASSLYNLSLRLDEAGLVKAALETIREAAERIEPYGRRFPDGLYGSWSETIRIHLKKMEGVDYSEEMGA